MVTDFDFQPTHECNQQQGMTPEEGCLGCIVSIVGFAILFIAVAIFDYFTNH